MRTRVMENTRHGISLQNRRTKMKKRLIAAALVAVLVLFLVAATATPVLADGALFIDPRFYDISQSNQRALILYDNSAGNRTQHLVLSVGFQGNAEEFAWVVPVPGRPEIGLSDSQVFWELSHLTRRYIPGPAKGGCAPADEAPPDGVDVIQEKEIGPYATAILSAENPRALVDWLHANEYLFPAAGEAILTEYIEKEWYFVATRINAVDERTGRALAEGTIEPLVLSFASDEIVYPLRITSLSAKSPQVLLYVLADRIVAPDEYPILVGLGNWQANSFTLEFADKVSSEDLSAYDILPGLVSTYLTADEFHVTKLRGWINHDRMVDMQLTEYRRARSLWAPGWSNISVGDFGLFMTIVLPVFGMYLWRRRTRESGRGAHGGREEQQGGWCGRVD